jgi:nitroreductase
MQFDDVILGRRSIRGYKPDPVPRALIEEIIALAMRAPSSMNTQPWNFYVITGEPLNRIRAGNTERMVGGVPQSREFRTGPAFAGQHRERQIGVAKQLFSAMGIAREDAERRQDWVLRGFRQFDAPVCVIVTYDRVLDGSDDTPFDCGAVTNALVNAAWSRGAWRRDQQPGHHAIACGPRARRHRRRPSYHEKHRAWLARRELSSQCSRLRTQACR